ERPQTVEQLARVIIHQRLAEEKSEIKRRLSGRSVYQPANSYQVGDELVFPALQFAYGTVTGLRDGSNPQNGTFRVIEVEVDGRSREFAAELQGEHPLNGEENGDIFASFDIRSVDELYEMYGPYVVQTLNEELESQESFVRLGKQWFIRGLMMDINIGHMHLAEAVLDMSGGGHISTDEIMERLGLDPDADEEVRRFSANAALLDDNRFDEVAPAGQVAWFLRRFEPAGVQQRPERLAYTPIPY